MNLRPRRARRAGEPLHFESPAVGHGVALGFLNENRDVFLRIRSARILRFDRDAIEDPEVVQTSLRFHDVPFPERFLDFDVHLSMDHS